MNKDLTLVIMAAGMGSRFGGLKQIEPVGPNGEFIIDYSIYDAIKAGFNKVVFIIKKSFENEFMWIYATLFCGINIGLLYQNKGKYRLVMIWIYDQKNKDLPDLSPLTAPPSKKISSNKSTTPSSIEEARVTILKVDPGS